MKPYRWCVRFQREPMSFVTVGGNPKWSIERLHNEVARVYGPVYDGLGIPKHMRVKPVFFREGGTKGFLRVNRMPSVRLIRLVA